MKRLANSKGYVSEVVRTPYVLLRPMHLVYDRVISRVWLVMPSEKYEVSGAL